MKRSTGVLALLALVASLNGCAMCQNPFDYCGPVIGPDHHPNCDFNARRGSLFHPMDDEGPIESMGPTPATGLEEISGEQVPAAAADTESNIIDGLDAMAR